jgi:hypothetical protein
LYRVVIEMRVRCEPSSYPEAQPGTSTFALLC